MASVSDIHNFDDKFQYHIHYSIIRTSNEVVTGGMSFGSSFSRSASASHSVHASKSATIGAWSLHVSPDSSYSHIVGSRDTDAKI